MVSGGGRPSTARFTSLNEIYATRSRSGVLTVQGGARRIAIVEFGVESRKLCGV